MATKKRASDFPSMGDYLDYLDNLEYAQSVRDAGLMPPPPPPPPKSSFLGDMAPMLGLLAMPFTGGLSASLGTALGSQVAGQVAANALIQGGLGGISAEASGGDFLSGFGKGALTGGITGGISSLAAPFANTIGADVLSSTGSQAFADIASGAVKGAAGSLPSALISGDASNLLTGAFAGGVGGGTKNVFSDLPESIRAPVTAAVTSGLLGRDPTEAAIRAFAGDLMKSGPTMPGAGTDANIQEGFFEPGGPGFMPTEFLDDAEVQRELTSLLGRYPEQAQAPNIQNASYVTRIDPLQELRLQTGLTPDNEGFYLADLGDTPPPAPTPITAPERNAFLEANIPEPETVQQLMQEYYPEIYRAPVADQRVEVTGTREVPIEQTAFEQFMQQYAAPAPVEPPGILEGPSTIDVTGSLYKPDAAVIEDIENLLTRYEDQGYKADTGAPVNQTIEVVGTRPTDPPLPWEGPSLEDEPIYEQPEFLDDAEVDRELQSLLGRYPAPPPPSDWFLGENIMSGVPEWDMAAVNAGLPIGNLEQDFFVEQAKEGPRIVDSAGNVGNFVNGEFVVDTGVTPNLSYAATGTPAPSPRAPAPAPAPASSEVDPMWAFLFGAMMTPQEQKQQEEQMAPARAVASPFGMDLLL